MGLDTIIEKEDRDTRGNKIDAVMRPTMNRLRIWDFRTQACTSTDRNADLAWESSDLSREALTNIIKTISKLYESYGVNYVQK